MYNYYNCCCNCACEQINKLWNYVRNITTSVSVGTTTTLAPGSNATVTDSGTPNNAILNFGIPAGVNGITPTIGANGNWYIGTIDTGVSASGTPGLPGTSATVAVGTTATLPAGASATVTNAGTTSHAIFNFGIPQGIPGTGGGIVAYSSIRGVLLNDANNPSLVASGKHIPWKIIHNNEVGLLQPSADKSYFQFTKTGRYLCIFSLRCATTVSGDNTVVNCGLYAQSIKKEMVVTASSFLTPNITDISGNGIFEVTNLNEQYNLINNSLITIKVQGAQSTQVFTNKFAYTNGVNMVDGMSVEFIRLGDLLNVV